MKLIVYSPENLQKTIKETFNNIFIKKKQK
jgi:hypothetical protein